MTGGASTRPPTGEDLGARQRWWGWGREDGRPELPAGAGGVLEQHLGPLGEATPAAPLASVRLEDPALSATARQALEGAVGGPYVRDDRLTRIAHAAGKSYPDLVRLRSGDGSPAPDAVVHPGTHAEVEAVLGACAEHGVAVVPFGGGTSVVGGVEPVREGFDAVIALDLRRLNRLVATDRRSLTATLEAGLPGPAAEGLLAARGLTLGHFPQSFEFATIGGFAATRSAGQASTGYGRFDELVLGLRCVAPAGEVVARPFPASAAGPSLREVLVGSEGVLGVITEVTLAVRPRPPAQRYEAWSFRSFGAGAEAFREMEQSDLSPDVARLSDEAETRLSMGLASSGSAVERIGAGYLRLRGHREPCLAILGWEDEAEELVRRRSRAAPLLRAHGGVQLGERPGRSWLRSRYAAPYLRDDLLDRGLLVETLETATAWSGLLDLHAAVTAALDGALRARGTPPLVVCHVSHLYPAGASLYFTFMARRERGAEIEQWRAAKEAASRAIVQGGGTITHHHGVGRDHAPWMADEVGELGLELLRAAKSRLDPQGIMNPGKLLG